jgi:hypothetical protein
MPHATGRHSRDTQNDRASLSGTNIERAGDYNQRVALQSIRVGLAKTKLEVAAYTGLTVPAVTNITNRLLEDGLIVQAGKLHGNRGQPAMTFAVNPDGCYSIGLNIDRDHVTIVLLDLAGGVRARATREVAFLGPEDVAAFFDQHCKAIASSESAWPCPTTWPRPTCPTARPPTTPGTPSTFAPCSRDRTTGP